MASIDELLESANQAGCDDELSFIIDEHLRIITVPERGVVLGVEGDKDVNRVRFRMNRFYHGSDLSEFCIRINYQNADGDINYFTVTEKTVETDSFCFIWTVAADATMVKGTVLFVVNCFMTDVDGVVQKAYHTTLGAGTVLEGLEPYEGGDIPEIVDYLTHLKNDLMIYSGTLVTGAEDAAAAASRSAAEAANAERNAKSYADSSGTSAEAAATSARAAKVSQTAASSSEQAAKVSESNAATSANAATEAATAAESSEKNAKNSATESATSADAAKVSETNAAGSATKANSSATASQSSAAEAASSATAAKASESGAATSANAAKTSETNVVKLLDSITTSYNGGVIGSQLVKIPVTRWSKSDSDAAYSCTLEKAECTAFLVPIATVEPDDVPSAIAAGLYGTCQALDGALKFWSKTKPTKELTIAVVLLEPDIKQKG
jgi:hypothetical protein